MLDGAAAVRGRRNEFLHVPLCTFQVSDGVWSCARGRVAAEGGAEVGGEVTQHSRCTGGEQSGNGTGAGVGVGEG